jgi:hypothetical protein
MPIASRVSFAAGALAVAACAQSAAAMDFELSGFGSAVVGRTFGGCTPQNTVASDFSGSCTRFVADWGHASVYHEQWSATPESRLGVQGTARFTPQFSATAQVVARTVSDPLAQVEWAYLTYAITPEWTVQAGRKRVPLFYYSDFQDVGYAYPWVRVPPDVYGWDVVNYNGANLTYNTTVADWSLRSSVFGGGEVSRRNAYQKIFYDEPKDVKWPRIAGADLEFARDWFTGRVVYMRSDYEQVDRDTGTLDAQSSGGTRGHHQAYGGSVNIDYGRFLARSEYSVFDRNQYTYKAISWFLSGGYRFGAWTPMLTVSNYQETTRFPDTYAPAKWSSVGASLRYDFGKSSAIKVQVDRIRDRGAPVAGSATLFSASYDFVF